MIDDTSRKHISLESENNVLRARVTELTDRLRSLNCVLEIFSIYGERNRVIYSGYPGLVARTVAVALPDSAHQCFC
ncbi:hypothetical protein ACS0TY_031672 [Phlomoides rotata]